MILKNLFFIEKDIQIILIFNKVNFIYLSDKFYF